MPIWAIYVTTTNMPMWSGESLEALERELSILEAHFGIGSYYISSMID
jgi:hypothetical protein